MLRWIQAQNPLEFSKHLTSFIKFMTVTEFGYFEKQYKDVLPHASG
jgi:hypothetical protein